MTSSPCLVTLPCYHQDLTLQSYAALGIIVTETGDKPWRRMCWAELMEYNSFSKGIQQQRVKH
ncbi:hypothetical protein E2C01_051518 [Portunus trituberculatus]|uniref:Uncharacterized protein n=1 Tax=Portunus trituberculatus TaxID=210409 RepID=A0A5B7GJS0_PORTR|nr:hypothetical protein [Portunus trituberculatus]